MAVKERKGRGGREEMCFGKAPAAREWMAATKNERLGELVGVLGAKREGCVVNVPMEEVRVVLAMRERWLGVEDEIH
jgi:hypothetical protein